MNTDLIFIWFAQNLSHENIKYTHIIAVCNLCVCCIQMAPYMTSTMISENNNTFFFSFWNRSLLQTFLVLHSAIWRTRLHEQFTYRANMSFSEILSVCQSFSSTTLKIRLQFAPCGAFSIEGWGICQKKCLYPSLPPQSDQTSDVAVQQCKILMNAFLNSTLNVVYMMGFTALLT